MSRKANFFWASYADLMTSLFFIMIVLFALTVVMLKRQSRASEDAIRKINEVTNALKQLDKKYFLYDVPTKRYKLNVDIIFDKDDDNIYKAIKSDQEKNNIIEAGKELYRLMDIVVENNIEFEYLLIIEGNTQRVLSKGTWNFRSMPDKGYNLSYRRALALVNLWKEYGYDFKSFKRCEILVCGSGYFGRSRQPMINSILDSDKNRRFTIQITPKIGQIKIK